MTTVSNIKGMILEEIVLFLLNNSGYTAVNVENDDSKLLINGHSGLELAGRGANHQIDAIADFSFVLPFVYPIRLLIEAKCYSTEPVGLPCVRNAFGVLSDVNEHWNVISDNNEGRYSNLIKKRYHYYYALFSSTGFTEDAMNYAYVHDIFLFDISSSAFIYRIISTISSLKGSDFGVNGNSSFDLDTKGLRVWIRSFFTTRCQNNNRHNQIINENIGNDENVYVGLTRYQGGRTKIISAINEALTLSNSYMAIIGKRFPVFVTPNPEIGDIFNEINGIDTIEIYWENQEHFYISKDARHLFSFSLPTELFMAYQQNGDLSVTAAIDMKEREMSTIQIFMNDENNKIIPVQLKLDMEWVNRYKNARQNHQTNIPQ